MRFGADFAALIDRYSPKPEISIALAVSGGSDSMALLHLAHEWASRAQRRLCVYTVDHGLRASAALEAQSVAETCQALGHDHHILKWENPKATQAAARAARYQLIGVAMQQNGAISLLTGHTFNDVTETVMIRRRRGVRDGLAAGPVQVAPFPRWPIGQGLTVLRPLIQTERSELRAHLRAVDVPWTEDPSNQDPKFERARIRQFLVAHPQLSSVLAQVSRNLMSARAIQDAALADTLDQVQVQEDGLIDTGSAMISVRLLVVLARMARGSDRDPRASAIADMIDRLTDPGARQTLGGAWFQRSDSGFKIGVDPAEVDACIDGALAKGRFVRDAEASLVPERETSFLVRHARPLGDHWREIISARMAHLQACLRTPLRTNCVEKT